MYNPLNAAIQIKQALKTDAVCPECGWEQQYKTIRYTGQNLVGIRMYRFLLKLMKGSI